MRTKSFKIDIYRYTVTLVQVEDEDKGEDVRKFLSKYKISGDKLDDTIKGVNDEAVNGGCTFYDHYHRQFVCLFYPFTSLSHQVEVYTHEKRHVEDRICEWLGINDIEASAYLAGFLGVKFWEFAGLTHWDK